MPKEQKRKNDPIIIYKDRLPYNNGSPARVLIESGLIEINYPVFSIYPKFVQDWIIRHEKGHYFNNSSDEFKADLYALKTSDKKNKNSLFECMEAVQIIVPKNKKRQNATIIQGLQIAANEGNKKAKNLLGDYANATGEPEDTSYKSWLLIGIIIIIFTIIIFRYAK